MIKFLQFIKSGNGWIRLIVALVIGSFIAGVYYTNLKNTLLNIEIKLMDHEKRLDRLELKTIK